MRHPSPLLGGADGIVNRWTIRDDEEEESVEEQNGIVNVNAVEAPVVQEVVTERRRVIRLGAGMTVGAHVHPVSLFRFGSTCACVPCCNNELTNRVHFQCH